MSLTANHVVLGLLVRRPSGYGYALQQQLSEKPFDHLSWAGSSIYKTLERLGEDGSIAFAGKRSSGKLSRVLYTATPEGVERFEAWMAEPLTQGPLRNEIQAKLLLARPVDLPRLAATVDAHAIELSEQLSTLENRSMSEPVDGSHWGSRALALVDDYEHSVLDTNLKFLARVAEEIEAYLDESGHCSDQSAAS